MSNPTIGNESQFNAPFDILPNLIYTNPTAGASQFTKPLSYPGNYQTFDYVYPFEPSSYLGNNTTTNLANSIYRPANVTADDIKAQFANATDKSPWVPIVSELITLTSKSTNLTGGALLSKAGGFAASALGSQVGVPQVSQVTDAILGQAGKVKTSIYSTLAFDQLRSQLGIKYSDFRTRKAISVNFQNTGQPLVGDLSGNAYENDGASFAQIRLDGASSALRGGRILYPIVASTVGAYSVFNLDGAGVSGRGWGDHDNPSAIRNDFTMRSHIATNWFPGISLPGLNIKVPGGWTKTKNPVEIITPFRGDRVNVIDFGRRSLKYAYQWNQSAIPIFGAQSDLTQDFIKFYLTGPKLRNGAGSEITDDIIVFRALLSSLSDTYTPSWTPQTMIGRADPNYHYTGVTRDLNLDFTVYATDRDEVKPIWRKLNALAGYTAPEYDLNTIAMKAPWMRITIGDLFHQQPAIITSLAYTLHDSDTTWEINIENDPTMMQVPHKVTVSMGLTLIPDYLPQKGGRFYSLAKSYDETTGMPTKGNDNWLSDTADNPEKITLDTKYLPPLPPITNEAPAPPPEISVTGDYGTPVNLG